MNELPPCQAYPSVPNWYTSHCAAVSDPHYYVYATRNMIVVLDLSAFRFIRAFIASHDKIQAIAAYKQFCFVGSTNGTIRAWSLLNGSLLMTLPGHSVEVTVIKCIRDGMVIVSGDKSGKIIVQETFQKKKQVISKVKSEVRTLAPLHHAGNDYLAVGYANGMIHVEKIGTDLSAETMYQLDHPDGDGIHSLSWQPPSPAFPDIFPLLASSTRKLKNAIIWNVADETRYSELKLPAPSPHWTDQQRNTIWFELAWSPAQEDEIYATSYMGMIVQYQIRGRKVVEIGRFRDLHSRIAFSFAWVQNGRYAVTYSIDKQIILWNVKQRDAVCRMLTQAGYIHSLDIPTWNPGQAAVGLGDSNIKIWNFMDNSGLSGQRHNFYESRILWKGLQGQIYNVRWHPTRENILAYSTEYGRVGIYDTSSNKCQPFKTYFNTKGSIPISWASDIQVGSETHIRDAIIACGLNNIAYAFDAKQPNAKAINITEWISQVNPAWSTIMGAKVKTSRCCSAVDPHSRFLALGNTDGAVEVYRLDTFKIIYVANSQQTAVKILSWRDGSTGSTLLAVGYNSGTITVHNIAEQPDNTSEVPIPDTTPMHTITEHKKRITGLAWSHHQERSLLASCAQDEFAYVYDIQNGSTISCFDQHLGDVLSVCWGLEDMDTLFTGGEDKFCYVWKYTDYPYAAQKNRVSKRAKELQAVDSSREVQHQQQQQASSSKRQESSTAPDSTAATKKRKTGGASGSKPNELMSSLKRSCNICRQPQLLRHCVHLAARIYGGNIKEAIETVKNRIPSDIDAAEYEYATYADEKPGDVDDQGEQDEDSKNLGLFFGDKNAMRALIGIEVNNFGPRPMAASADSYDGRLLLDIMQSNYKAFESSPVNWVALALSPMAGKETWLNLMETQAKHLAKQNQPVLAATCFLACSKVYDAISVYREAGMYREAIALAKLRLPEVDSIIPTLFAEWADKLQKEATQEELAAMCFLHAKLPGSSVNAINLLVRRKKESYMFWAACLAVLLQDSTAEERISQYLQMLHERLAKKNQQQ